MRSITESEASSSATEPQPATVRSSASDIDFDDVFGGPPMWTRYSYSGSRIKPWEESTCSPTGSVEWPIFGESYSLPRRHSSDEVFRRSDESDRPTGSTTLSTAKIKPFSTSVPGVISLPGKMTEPVDIPVFGSNAHTTNTRLSRFSSPATQSIRNNSGQTLLARESSSVNESLYSTRHAKIEHDHKSKPKTGSVSSEFHFSMHKWANVGVPLLMSTLKGSSEVSSLSINNMQDSGFPNEDLSPEKQDKNPVSGISRARRNT